ncbi:hypothetical protein WS63_31500 [Burkholderia stagnalis]|uniref:DUF3022 domain-containing protein n=1 Tax=Burkholderia stagnalis TaxID=1503054 RepID=A0A125KVM2_9BURK|nr:DUF3022 domain-containing protein [Burkholderia stagnalis]KVD96126.1 hypothetical protein WS63_31500 [Burkholderia stagnalis]KVL87942.1 hypothetical protein WT02_28325 [Burkholderia stagnalis]KVM07488.1 hypothetical protein WT04_21685 [Burkholderia stagnalis]KVN17243.1 hypothetical protein WT09_13480 [Burkholderia stagnalis]KVO55637.1 hypothetical protein WT18_23050 [Burkholderia stagnalis]
MASNPDNLLEHDDLDAVAADVDDDLNTTVHLEIETGQVVFHAAWADARCGVAQHAVELAIDCRTMERYAELDAVVRRRVHAMLHETVQQMADQIPAGEAQTCTLTVEITDAMLDAAIRLQ